MVKQLMSKLNNKHFLALLGNGVLAVFGIAIMSLLSHALSITDVGKWFFFLTLIGLCESIRNGFLGTATVKFYAGTEKERATTVLGSVWALALGLTAIVMLLNLAAVLLLPYTNNDEVILTIKWLGLTFLSSLPFSVIFWKLQADEDYMKILVLRMVNSGGMIICFITLMVLHKMTLEAAVLYNFLTNCLTSIVGIAWRQARVRTVFKRSRESMTELFHFGKFSLGSTLTSTMLRSTDTFIITGMLGPAALAVFAWPARLMEIVEIPLRSFVATGMSGMARAFNNDDIGHVSYIFKKYAGMLTIAFVPLVLLVLLLADVPINLLGGPKFQGTEAANIYRFFMLFSLMAPIDRFNGVTLDVIHKPKINFYKVLLMLGVNIVADYVGVLVLKNIYGAVLASFLTNFSGLLFGYFCLRRYVPYSISGIISTGYLELKDLIRNNLPGRKK